MSGQSVENIFISEKAFRTDGMLVLGSWATLNILGGLAGRANTTESAKSFYEMNAIWNGVNLGIAAFGYFSALKMDVPNSGFDLYTMQSQMDKVLLFNAGLDLAYIATGLYLMERSNRSGLENPLRLKGYGQSIVLQGAFLLAFDIAMVLVHKKFIISESLIFSMNVVPGGIAAQLHLN